MCGIWGTLAVGIFSSSLSIGTQFIGVIAYGVFCLITSLGLFTAYKSLMGLRVSDEEEEIGLDISEHGTKAYFSS